MLDKLTPQEITEHKLEGYYYKFYSEILSEQQRERYKKIWNTQWLHNHNKTEFLKQLNDWNQKESIKIVLLKGAALLHDFYPDFGSRFMCDIDIYLHRNDLDQLDNFLTSNNFTRLKINHWEANQFKVTYQKEDINIEIHHQLFFHSKAPLSIKASPHYSNLYQLTNEFQFAMLAGHYAFQHTCLKMYWLIDLVHIAKTNVDWKQIEFHAKQMKMERSLELCKMILSKYFNIKCSYRKSLATLFVNESLLRSYSQGGFRYYFTKHSIKDSLTDAFFYDLYWIKNKIKNLLKKSKTKKSDVANGFQE